ncbi:MAG: hypothetical protein A3B86_02555 [Candidatus Yanofskybacteria bacterium RIFCSPHIGHO2_02_FULL_38_22b]|uniref:Uncharacterized protein n=1 Tax=Candidatus Yanofskybacteria bacterium RIFCSPHIGHO2_02_FULL_38_22b TaxID=1802673 RepID=A0A1F8F3M1_9BACT|nr:MAG: hypothetical protein A2816_03300 [Candidatus Yanofskybacteria bacterium RIFCSPHIGHO2_01_FULL_39_44]OGN07737.1 MAG: hypothetical protein A3B86_02555 [Candidatus Yanofskybacteria bacterium RIFCSPHIGHO2_02_FULL_38_22b]OGN20619.1 MAG: hypothetical protein A2910_02390 [Candidatus Yanofskybacteria bacterium RIFCSPLOWO2_01_FULL_39_28]
MDLSNLSKKLTSALVVAVVLVSGLAYYFYSQYSDLKENPNKITQEETAKIVGRVSKLMVLPEGETPTLATVSDPEKLQTQPFFAKAKKGDKLLLYANARKAILYDLENNKIVEVAPINIGEPNKSPAPTPRPVVNEEEE